MGRVSARVNIGLVPRGSAMKQRVRWLCQRKDWPANEWRLDVREDGGCIALAGAEPDALPDGLYTLRVDIEGLKALDKRVVVDLPRGGVQRVPVDVRRDRRRVELTVPVDSFDEQIGRILLAEESVLDQLKAAEWLRNNSPRSARKACLLNILAMTRVRPAISNSLAPARAGPVLCSG